MNPYKNFELCLLDWNLIEPFWRKNDLHPLNRGDLVRAFHQAWFKRDDRGERIFMAGAITYDELFDTVLFVNGRHRTNLLLLYSPAVPLAVNESILEHPVLKNTILKRDNQGIEIEMPSLPTLRFRNSNQFYAKTETVSIFPEIPPR